MDGSIIFILKCFIVELDFFVEITWSHDILSLFFYHHRPLTTHHGTIIHRFIYYPQCLRRKKWRQKKCIVLLKPRKSNLKTSKKSLVWVDSCNDNALKLTFSLFSETLNAKKKTSRDHEISKPRGQCGRGASSGHGGYSLQKSMGLEAVHYQRIQVTSIISFISRFHTDTKYHFSELLGSWDTGFWMQKKPIDNKTRLSSVVSKLW